MHNDPFNLARFITAQSGIYDQVVLELGRGLKTSHWMWFVFPQIHGLGLSETAKRYALSGLEESRAYLEHPLLGQRLLECAGLVNQHTDKTAEQVFGAIDAMKFRSSMTLFYQVKQLPCFKQALDQFFASKLDERTLAILSR